MSKRCAKCEKTVYPTEELKCLDKVWHKACFRCWECNMALNMKNYKGYDKKPYCNAHYPTTRFTAVAETPEMSRIAQNTKMQSQIQYHEDFEKSKGKFTVVDDDPETLRIRQNTQIQSSVKYHEDFEKNIKGSKIQVADDPETLRIKASTNVISGIEYKGLRERSNDMEARRSSMQQDEEIPKENPKRISNYDPTKVGGMRMAPVETANPSPYSNKNVGHSTVYSSQGKDVEQSGNRRVGSIADYDPLNENFGSLQQGYAPVSTMSKTQQWEETIPEPSPQNHAPKEGVIKRQTSKSEPEHHYPAPQHAMQSQDMGGHVMGGPQQGMGGPQHGMGGPQHGMGGPQHGMGGPQHGMGGPQHGMGGPQHGMGGPQHGMGGPQHGMGGPQHGMGGPQHGMGGAQHGMPSMAPASQPPAAQPAQPPPQPAAPQPPKSNASGSVYQAMYDYEAQDEDEVGFIDGDLIIECQPIDEGWMFGTIRRTGLRGMLPANYVEQVQ